MQIHQPLGAIQAPDVGMFALLEEKDLMLAGIFIFLGSTIKCDGLPRLNGLSGRAIP